MLVVSYNTQNILFIYKKKFSWSNLNYFNIQSYIKNPVIAEARFMIFELKLR